LLKPSQKNIVLTGFMAVGKSVVGQRLARKLKRSFLDLDTAIEQREGMKVHELFSFKGEPYFRRIEKEMLREALSGDDKIIATGGGAIMDEDNLRMLKETSLLISLRARPETLLARAATGGSQRPLLQGDDKLERIKELLRQRERAYGQAHLSIDTEARSVDEVVEQIAKAINSDEI
jgi:shikimate kinase